MFLFYANVFCQDKKENYTRYLDSAEFYFDDKPKLSLSFLDSIPMPLEENIDGKIDDYFWIKAVAFDRLNELSLSHQNFLLALKQAEQEEDYQMAGDMSLELFFYQYQINNNQEAFNFIDKAKFYYKKIGDDYGLLEAQQALAYAKFSDGEWQENNNLTLEHLDSYKEFDDKYLYLTATYMLASSNAFLNNIKASNIYFDEFKTLKNTEGVSDNNFLFYEGVINLDIANYYYRKQNIDSTLVYLSKTNKSRRVMNHSVIIDYFSLYTNVYKEINNTNLQQAYIDSLNIFEKDLYMANVKSSFQINDSLSQSETNLESANKKRQRNLISVVLLLLGVIVLIYIFYKNKKKTVLIVASFKDRLSELAYLKSNQQKLSAKVHALEEYIKDLKGEIKNISKVSDIESQRNQITNLYKKIHLKSTNVLAKEESHLKLINELNIDFFTQINKKYPQLNESEIIICYYLFMDFKNKDIAFFLNTSIRAIESKRYRIGKKLNLVKGQTTLSEHITEIFGDTKRNIA